jgi:hypothetical protein
MKEGLRLSIAGMTLLVALGLRAAPTRGDDYQTLADALATPIFVNLDGALRGFSDSVVMVRNEMAYQRLKGLGTASGNLANIRNTAQGSLQECNRGMEELRRLNRGTIPDISGIASKAIAASPALMRERDEKTNKLLLTPSDQKAIEDLAVKGLSEVFSTVVNAWQASGERDKYRGSYRASLQAGLMLPSAVQNRYQDKRPIYFGVGMGVKPSPKGWIVAELTPNGPAALGGLMVGDEILSVDATLVEKDRWVRISGNQGSEVTLGCVRKGAEASFVVVLKRTLQVGELPLLSIDLNGSIGGVYDSDCLWLRNDSGREITDCTLMVDLAGRTGTPATPQTRRQLHYISSWPAGEWRVARYPSSTFSGIARDQSLDLIERVTVELYSQEFRNTIIYNYANTDEFDRDIKALMNGGVKLSLKRHDKTALSKAGVTIKHTGGTPVLPVSFMTVRYLGGLDNPAVRFHLQVGMWNAGDNGAKFLSSELFNEASPRTIQVELEFPGTSYKHVLSRSTLGTGAFRFGPEDGEWDEMILPPSPVPPKPVVGM